MSELKKLKVTVKNFDVKAVGDIDALYGRVRLEDEQGNTFYFKEVVMLKYLKYQGALVTDVSRVWYYKHLAKNSIVLIAFEKSDGKVEYDLDDMRIVAKSSMFKGVLMSLAAIPAGIIVATATYGLGLLLIPGFMYYGHRNVFKIPGMPRRNTLVSDLACHGVTVR
jgi:hypothetical protein